MNKQEFIEAVEYMGKKFSWHIFILIVCLSIGILLGDFFKFGYDSTDGKSRSGLGLYTDNLTGCQYLSAKNSGITPRVDSEGNHICRGE